MKKCSLVITIASTAGLEAAFYKRPTIVLSDKGYCVLPCVYRLKSIEELPHAISSSLKKEVDISTLNEYVNLIDKNSFEFDLSGFTLDYQDYFYSGGYSSSNVDISISKAKAFLEEHRSKFELLVFEHIKKIKLYKEYESKKQI